MEDTTQREKERQRYEELKKARKFRKLTFRGMDVDRLLDVPHEKLAEMLHARARRRFYRGLNDKPKKLIAKLKKAKKNLAAGEKPRPVKTHLRDMIVVPEMLGNIIGIYNGKLFNGIEVRGEMIGHYLGEFSITYKPVTHGRPGLGASHASRFIPLK
mmetsp:Transcript_29974/g.41424  ORF Transcript_29974/g.41424 Transcript_29974/m.41424 type:complete len:157 (+) Transcript_29974:49-519(+)|eukprot:CAMPEP_0201490112 /NCGR_PEP_ID=MMETSP0151_2-20130828/25099_1 /ASSEMBLY_ACC=CAM_ASM_000257 /TAXON_ID=200890 /ORGANISM="Paramoeba atlantica, Strain 621/1 / CCAP 1560/9" /LENGTH=156 /DNA_ID=CAMNT_0047875939 /DNA_START=54 /DNA_END=524 /DNA_ORIENTATION=+